MISLPRRLELAFWAVLPALLALLLLAVYAAPKYLPGLSSIMPLLHLMPVFYWGLIHAREMPYWFVFLLGLLADAAGGLPLGFSALLYLVFLALLHVQRKYIAKEGFLAKWSYFAVLLAACEAGGWILMAILTGEPRGLAAVLARWALALCCYPMLHRAFDLLAECASERRWRILHG